MEAPGELVPRGRATRLPARRKKRAIVQAYGTPLAGVRVICVDELEKLSQALEAALADWNAHRHPYRWKKPPQEQILIPGGFPIIQNAQNTSREPLSRTVSHFGSPVQLGGEA